MSGEKVQMTSHNHPNSRETGRSGSLRRNPQAV
jgi:hypothetical protein